MRIFKRKLALFLLAVAACISVIGTGFSAWIFTNAIGHLDLLLQDTANVGVTTASTISNSEFNCEDLPALVVLDGGAVGGVNNTRTGVNFYKSGKSNYNTANDNANYDQDENKIESTLPEEILAETKFDISFWHIYSSQSADQMVFYMNLEVPEALDGIITHSQFYYSYVNYTQVVTDADKKTTAKTRYYIDLKKLAQDWGKYETKDETLYFYNGEYRTKEEMEEDEIGVDSLPQYTKTTHTFTLSTTLLNSLFSYTDEYKGTGVAIHKKISEVLETQSNQFLFVINLLADDLAAGNDTN